MKITKALKAHAIAQGWATEKTDDAKLIRIIGLKMASGALTQAKFKELSGSNPVKKDDKKDDKKARNVSAKRWRSTSSNIASVRCRMSL